MKELFKKYKSVVRFVVLFLGTYLLLSVVYAFYLKFSLDGKYYPDFLTHLVARQCNAVLSSIGYNSFLASLEPWPSLAININHREVAEIVEGCNSVSIVILFISFVVAFAKDFKKTFLFLFAGSVLIYTVNILRIVILCIALYKYPQYENILHSVVFPGIIYGLVFFLWMVWVHTLKLKPKDG